MKFLSLFFFALVINYSAQTFVDLTHEYNHTVPVYPLPEYLNNKFVLTALRNETTPEGSWIAYNSFCTVEHISTNIDAPYHFYKEGRTVEEIPLENLIAPAAVIDVTAKVFENPNYRISATDVKTWVANNGMFLNNSVILGRTGWSKKFNNPVDYLGHETNIELLRYPGFGVEAIREILRYKSTHNIHVVGFGIDTMSLDHGPSKVFEAHQIVHGENLYIIENMNNLEALPAKGATLFVMPLKITGGTGAPSRIVAQLHAHEVAELTESNPVTDSVSFDENASTPFTDIA